MRANSLSSAIILQSIDAIRACVYEAKRAGKPRAISVLAIAFRQFVSEGEYRQISVEVFSLLFSLRHFFSTFPVNLPMKRGGDGNRTANRGFLRAYIVILRWLAIFAPTILPISERKLRTNPRASAIVPEPEGRVSGV